MQKRCTSSACRRYFIIKPEAPVSCPYCGKVYPRIGHTAAASAKKAHSRIPRIRKYVLRHVDDPITIYSLSKEQLLPETISRALTSAGIESLQQLSRMTRAEVIASTKLKKSAVIELERLLECNALSFSIPLVLESFGENKILVIKAVRHSVGGGIGLAEAKKLTESCPVRFHILECKKADFLEVIDSIEGARVSHIGN